VISGVCSGLGKYFEIDPIIFRFGFVALLFAGGSSIIIYLVLLIVIPKEPLLQNPLPVIPEQTQAVSIISSNRTSQQTKRKTAINSFRFVIDKWRYSNGFSTILCPCSTLGNYGLPY